jgi:hypothetical protein
VLSETDIVIVPEVVPPFDGDTIVKVCPAATIAVPKTIVRTIEVKEGNARGKLLAMDMLPTSA